MSKHCALRVIPLVGDLVARAMVDTDLLGDITPHDTYDDIRDACGLAIEEVAEQWEEEAGLPFMSIPDDRLEEAKEVLLRRVIAKLDRRTNDADQTIADAIADGIVCVPQPDLYRSV